MEQSDKCYNSGLIIDSQNLIKLLKNYVSFLVKKFY